MPRRAISDVHEWTNENPTVPSRASANLQARERASAGQRGKKTLLSLTPARPGGAGRPAQRTGEAAPLRHPDGRRRPAHPVARGHGRAGSLAGAAHLLHGTAGVPRRAQRGRKPPAEQKGTRPPDPRPPCRRGPRKRGLPILRRPGRGRGGDRKVTTGITGLWPPSVRSDAAF